MGSKVVLADAWRLSVRDADADRLQKEVDRQLDQLSSDHLKFAELEVVKMELQEQLLKCNIEKETLQKEKAQL